MDNNKNINIENLHLDNANTTLTIINKQVLPEREERERVEISGNIDSVLRYIKQRFSLINWDKAVCLITTDEDTIRLCADPSNIYGDVVTGKLQINEDIMNFGLNTTKVVKSPEEFVKHISRFAYLFADKEEFQALRKILRNFKVSANSNLDNQKANNGSRNFQVQNDVLNNPLPESITLKLPIFQGLEPELIKVDIVCELIPAQNTTDFWFEAIDLPGLINEKRKFQLELQKQEIEAASNGKCLIIES